MANDAEITTLEGIVRAHGTSRPNMPMATFDGDTRTYGQAHTRSNRIASGLISSGVTVGSRVALISKNRAEFFEVLFAVRKVGAVLVPINWRLSPPEMEYILDNSLAEFLFVGAEFGDAVEVMSGTLTRIRGIVSLGTGTAFAEYEQWMTQFPDLDPGLESEPADIVLQLYTSGTTGQPKGVLLSNYAVFAFYRNAERQISHNPSGIHLNCLPLFHVGGINWSLQALAQGAHVIGSRDFDPDEALRMIEEFRVTHVMTVPAVIQLLLSRPLARLTDCSSVEVIVYGGSPIPVKVLKDAIATFGNVMYGLYGMTEMSFGATLLMPADHVDPEHPERLTSVGTPFDGTEMKVVDVVTEAELGAGESGELWFRSPQLASGYWDRPDATAEAFRPDGWYRTGDIGQQTDGYYYVTDRLKDLIISGGENIYPAEIERVLYECDSVAEAVVFAVPHDRWGETPRAEVVLVAGSQITEDELLEFVRARLARYKCPSSIGFRNALPRTAAGKITRHTLRAEFSTSEQAVL